MKAFFWFMQLPEPFSFIFTWFAALPLIFWVAQAITNAIVKDFLILKVFLFCCLYIQGWLTGVHWGDCSFSGPMSKLREWKSFLLRDYIVSTEWWCKKQCELSKVCAFHCYYKCWVMLWNLCTEYCLLIYLYISCGTAMVYDSASRLITLPELEEAWVKVSQFPAKIFFPAEPAALVPAV